LCVIEVLLQMLLNDVRCMMQVGDDNYEVVPGSQFVVSRTACKDNSSSYKVTCCFLTTVRAVLTSCCHRRQRCATVITGPPTHGVVGQTSNSR